MASITTEAAQFHKHSMPPRLKIFDPIKGRFHHGQRGIQRTLATRAPPSLQAAMVHCTQE
ncbi:hypothetical protein BC832DRAFT_557067 [Gaertneriomyces semiglobifer]|nr:hypothetical protein BC832DRAFT_557067 [Gaertneriomyces semiglobifer]